MGVPVVGNELDNLKRSFLVVFFVVGLGELSIHLTY